MAEFKIPYHKEWRKVNLPGSDEVRVIDPAYLNPVEERRASI